MMSSVRRDGCANRLKALHAHLSRLMPMITVITRVRYRPRTTVLRHRHSTIELLFQHPLLHIPRYRIYLLR